MNEYLLKTLAKDYQDVFIGRSDAQQGLRVLFDLINQCHVFTVNTKSPHDAAVLEGMRKVGIYLMQQVAMAPKYGGEFLPENLARFTQAAGLAKKYHDVLQHEAMEDKD